tara:strand:- start:866 stop:1231 length:366 start_codon:yes stop_codon:yes gene_type:complete
MIEELKDYTIEGLENLKGTNPEASELHHEIFNTDYFIIGYAESERWLDKNVGSFEAIRTIQEYEKFNFGEIYTDLSSSEKVCNMYTYIKGEEILHKSKTLSRLWNRKLDDEDLQDIINELN